MTIAAELELSDRQRDVLGALRAGRPYADPAALGRLTGVGPNQLAALVRLGLVERRDAGGRDPLYHLTEAGREAVRPPEDESLSTEWPYPGSDHSTDTKENVMSTSTVEKPKAAPKPRAAAKPADSKAKAGKGQFVRHPRDEREDKLVTKALAAEFGADWANTAAGLTYGRKWLRYKKGIRTSTPPIGTLSKEEAARVAAAIDAAIK